MGNAAKEIGSTIGSFGASLFGKDSGGGASAKPQVPKQSSYADQYSGQP